MKNQIKKNQRKQQKKSNTDSDVKKTQHILTKSRYSIGNNYYSCLNSKVRWLKSDIKADNRAFKKAHATSSFLKSVYLLDFVCFFKLWLLYTWISHWSIQFT